MVEMAVMAPLFVTAMLGMIEIGYAFMVKQTVTLASREGARAASLPGGTLADVETAVEGAMAAAHHDPAVPSDPEDPGFGSECCGYGVTSNISTVGPEDEEVWVEVTIPLDCVSVTGLVGGSGIDITSKTAMRREGFEGD
ncbi:MAG: pilus assembly protein [Phycisphaerae bacterium]|nr:pilus assembly protein [Phycisphaerae bacterium]